MSLISEKDRIKPSGHAGTQLSDCCPLGYEVQKIKDRNVIFSDQKLFIWLIYVNIVSE